jgi:predicted RNase H-like nuclease (RuvC/YqgF family)
MLRNQRESLTYVPMKKLKENLEYYNKIIREVEKNIKELEKEIKELSKGCKAEGSIFRFFDLKRKNMRFFVGCRMTVWILEQSYSLLNLRT